MAIICLHLFYKIMQIQNIPRLSVSNNISKTVQNSDGQKLCGQTKPLSFEQANMFKTLAFSGKKYTSDLKDFADKHHIDKRIADLYLFRGRLNEDAKNDLLKLKDCYKNNKVISQEFVKNYKSDEEAEKKAKVGEVCHVGNNKYVSIKMENGFILPLSLSKSKYLKLFPPVERFSVMQNQIGDCWLLAACDALYSNPNTRARFLSVFKENEKGGIDVNFDGFEIKNGKSVPINPKEATYKNTDKSTGVRAILPMGFACIEEAIERQMAQLGHERIQRICDMMDARDEDVPFMFIDDVLYTDDDIETFQENIRDLLGDPMELAQNFVDPMTKEFFIGLNEKNTKKCLRQLDKRAAKKRFTEDEIDLMKKILNTHSVSSLINADKKNANITYVKEIFPTEAFLRFQKLDFRRKKLKENIKSQMTSPYINAGESEYVFKMFGLFAKTISAKNAKEELEYINDDYLITGSVSKKSEYGAGFKLFKNHEYSIKVLNTKDGKKLFGVKNPHNASQEIVMGINELCRTFDYITYAHPW